MYPTSPCSLLIKSSLASLSSATHSTSEFISTPLISFQSILSFDGTLLIKDKLSISGEGTIKGKVIYKTISISDKAQIEGTLKKYKGSDSIIVKDDPVLKVENKSDSNTRAEPKKATM